MKILIVGYGSIGKRHIKNLLRYTKHDLLICSKQKDIRLPKKRCKIFRTLNQCINENPDCAIIANNTNEHLHTSIKLAQANCHLFIEKPLSNTLVGIKHLEKITKKNNLITMMGCNLRFHPGLILLKKLLSKNIIGKILHVQTEFGSYLPEWHPYENFRTSYAAKKSLGGGAVLTLIHEIDYLFWLFGDVTKILSVSGTASNFKIDVEDFSSSLLEFSKKLTCILHLNYFQQPRSRWCKIIGTNGTIYWDYEHNHLKVYVPKKQKWVYKMKDSNFNKNQMYVDELKHFFSCIKNNKQSINDVSEGIKVLRIAIDIKNAGKSGKVIKR